MPTFFIRTDFRDKYTLLPGTLHTVFTYEAYLRGQFPEVAAPSIVVQRATDLNNKVFVGITLNSRLHDLLEQFKHPALTLTRQVEDTDTSQDASNSFTVFIEEKRFTLLDQLMQRIFQGRDFFFSINFTDSFLKPFTPSIFRKRDREQDIPAIQGIMTRLISKMTTARGLNEQETLEFFKEIAPYLFSEGMPTSLFQELVKPEHGIRSMHQCTIAEEPADQEWILDPHSMSLEHFFNEMHPVLTAELSLEKFKALMCFYMHLCKHPEYFREIVRVSVRPLAFSRVVVNMLVSSCLRNVEIRQHVATPVSQGFRKGACGVCSIGETWEMLSLAHDPFALQNFFESYMQFQLQVTVPGSGYKEPGLPPLFNRGFIKLYACFLHVNSKRIPAIGAVYEIVKDQRDMPFIADVLWGLLKSGFKLDPDTDFQEFLNELFGFACPWSSIRVRLLNPANQQLLEAIKTVQELRWFLISFDRKPVEKLTSVMKVAADTASFVGFTSALTSIATGDRTLTAFVQAKLNLTYLLIMMRTASLTDRVKIKKDMISAVESLLPIYKGDPESSNCISLLEEVFSILKDRLNTESLQFQQFLDDARVLSSMVVTEKTGAAPCAIAPHASFHSTVVKSLVHRVIAQGLNEGVNKVLTMDV